MSGKELSLEQEEMSLTPTAVPIFETEYRRIKTEIPHQDSLDILLALRDNEPRSMRGQAPVLWDNTEDIYIRDRFGNQWVDLSSGVLIANVGHNHPQIIGAIQQHTESGKPLATYGFSNETRANLVNKLIEITPDELDRVFLLTTGSETTEAAMKIARTNGLGIDNRKGYIISFGNSFHGRTLAAQLAGGALGGGKWAEGLDPNNYFTQVSYPSEPGREDLDFSMFRRALEGKNIKPLHVAGVITETFPGRSATLMPKSYIQDLRQWCYDHGALLILDEVQSGFGRTGRFFGFEHYDVVPDIACFGKGISSSLPLSAVIGRKKYMDLYGPHEMTSTHGGSPLPCAAALANIDVLLENDMGLIRNAEQQGAYLSEELQKMTELYGGRVLTNGIGLVHAIQFYDENGNPDAKKAKRMWEECIYSGIMLFAPVGIGGATIKICPPLTITNNALSDVMYGTHGFKEKLDKVMR